MVLERWAANERKRRLCDTFVVERRASEGPATASTVDLGIEARGARGTEVSHLERASDAPAKRCGGPSIRCGPDERWGTMRRDPYQRKGLLVALTHGRSPFPPSQDGIKGKAVAEKEPLLTPP